MNEVQLFALYRMSTMPERDRRATEETTGRMFAAIMRVARRSRRARVRAVVLQPETSAR